MGTLRRHEVVWACLFAVILAGVASLTAIALGQRPLYYVGQVAPQPIVSRVEFKAEDKLRTLQNRNAARASQPNLYVRNDGFLHALEERFAALIALADYQSMDLVDPEYARQVRLTEAGLAQLQDFARQPEKFAQWQQLTDEFLRKVFDLAILNPDRYVVERSPTAVNKIVIIRPGQDGQAEEQDRYVNVIVRADDANALAEKIATQAVHFPEPLRKTVTAMVMDNLQPTYLFDRELTEQRRKERVEREQPVQVTYGANEVLVPAGNELVPEDLELIEREQRAYQQQQSAAMRAFVLAGRAGMILLVAAGIWVYIFAYNYKIVRNPMRGLAITVLLLLCQFLAVGMTRLHPEFLYATAIFPTLVAAICLSIVYDQRFALAMGALHAVLVIVSLRLPLEFAVVLLTGTGVAVALLREVRSRSKLVQVGFIAGLAMAGTALLTSFASRPLYLPGETMRIAVDCGYALFIGLVTGLVVQGMLPAIEKVFKVTTAMTLRELNDASHPLLQRLAQEAPGTYQHSLRIADIAEAAAEAIDADGLLCRVGAMYHDVGKINKPQYFIENQGGGPNRHSKLSPAMSLLIIVGHVKDGTEMAREYGLPPVLRHFIESHHGTTLVEYFYHAARKQKEAEDAEGPSEFEFRYPGPKPQTKEAAIMLLCDSIEAAARTLAEPTPVRIEQMVHQMANKRLMDGQFDECNLTLQELHKIEQSITKTLAAIYHGRIKYPVERPKAGGPTEPAASRSVAS